MNYKISGYILNTSSFKKHLTIIDYVGPEGPRGFGPFYLKSKAHVDEEEVPGDEMKGIQTARTYYRGRPCPRQAKIMGEKVATSLDDIYSRITKEILSHIG